MTNIEAFLASVTKHGVAESTKLKATECGHIYNVKADKNLDNGTIVAKNAYLERDIYSAKDSEVYSATSGSEAGFEGVIREVAANGNFIVEVIRPADALLVLTVPGSYISSPARFAAEDQFYNAKDSIMRCYELVVGDEFAVSAECFDTTPSKGQTVSVTASTRKLHTA